MPRVLVNAPRPDTLEIEVGPDRARALGLTVLASALAGLYAALPLAGGWALFALAVGALAWPWLAVLVVRALRPQHFTVTRSPGRLFFDGEPLELARVELRLLQWPLLQQPRGYALSLWMLTSGGPVDLPLGLFPDLLSATGRSGDLEDFLQKAGVKQPGRVPGPHDPRARD